MNMYFQLNENEYAFVRYVYCIIYIFMYVDVVAVVLFSLYLYPSECYLLIVFN